MFKSTELVYLFMETIQYKGRSMRNVEKFKNLDKKKQKRIINAALKEFTAKGFDQASTNRIVKEAGIGKGMLFYYFKSKKDLYLYLVDYCIEIIREKYFHAIDTSDRKSTRLNSSHVATSYAVFCLKK